MTDERINELEKENRELKEKITNFLKTISTRNCIICEGCEHEDNSELCFIAETSEDIANFINELEGI